MEGGPEGVINVGMLAGGLAGGGGGVEVYGVGHEPDGVSGDKRPPWWTLWWGVARGGGQAREKVPKNFRVRVGMLGR